MKDLPKHLLGGIIAFVVIALAGGGIWFWTNAQLAAAVENRSQLQQQISALGAKGIFPSSQNLQLLKGNVEAATSLSTALLPRFEKQTALLAPLTAEGKGLAPDLWKQRLFERRDALKKLAESRKTQLADDFYFGFKRYRVASPREGTTMDLGVQLAAIDEISRILFESKVASLTEVRRVFVEDTQGPSGGPAGAGEEALAAQVVPGGGGLYRVFPFEFRFQTSPEGLKQFVNGLARSEYFFVTRFLVVENLKNVVPKRSEISGQTAAAAGAGIPGLSATAGESKLLVPVLGQEQISVRARIDCILWNPPAAEPAKPARPVRPAPTP
jgi:hypothetical protein